MRVFYLLLPTQYNNLYLSMFLIAEADEAVSLLNSESYLELHHSSYEGKLSSIGIAFRTSAPVATILHKPAHNSDQADFRIILTSGKSLKS